MSTETSIIATDARQHLRSMHVVEGGCLVHLGCSDVAERSAECWPLAAGPQI